MESHCLPILTYAVESLNIPQPQIIELNSWWNSVYRKIFNYHKWESVRLLIFMLGRLDLLHIINLKTLTFLTKVYNETSTPDIFRNYFEKIYNVSKEYATLFQKYNCYGCSNHTAIKFRIHEEFKTSLSSSLTPPVSC